MFLKEIVFGIIIILSVSVFATGLSPLRAEANCFPLLYPQNPGGLPKLGMLWVLSKQGGFHQ